MQPFNATEVGKLNSLELRNANSTKMTDHIAVNSNELLQLNNDL